ncbi:MAG: hypothetical protein K5637_00450 [Lachnospiraceae bacterium]|nr:hypothetical protein [Lachnospiraceae bacterium]
MASETGFTTPEYCLKCGEPLAAGTRICPKCGASIINQVYRKNIARTQEEDSVKEDAALVEEPEKSPEEKPAAAKIPRVKRERSSAARREKAVSEEEEKAARKTAEERKAARKAAGEKAGNAAGKVLSALKVIGGAIAAGAVAFFGFAKKMWKKNPKFFIGTCAAIFILIVILVLSGNKTYRKPLASYVKGLNDQNAELMLSAFPSQITDEGSSYAETISGAVQTSIENLENTYGSCKITYEVTNTVRLGDAEIAEIEQRYSQKCNAEINIIAGYDLKTEYTVNYKVNGEDKSDTRTLHFIVVKTGGKWYLDPLTSDM